MNKKLNVKSGDQVIVISGEEKGKHGKVLTAFPKTGRVIVEGIAMVKKHQKSRAQGQPGGIIEKESSLDASNVMLVCPKCGKPTKVAHKKVTVEKENGTKAEKTVRICKKCGAEIN